MNKNQTDFINIISAYYNETDINTSEMNLDEVYNISKIHNLSALVFYKIKAQISNEEIYKKFERAYLSQITQSTRQEFETLKIIALLNKMEIEHILIKGIVLRKIYSPKELRAMGDVDFVVSLENQSKVHTIMLELGYEFKYESNGVFSYFIDKICFEVHTTIKDYAINKEKCMDFLSNIWENAVSVNNSTFILEKNFNFAYLLIHLLKHFSGMGIGIRFFLDILLYMKHNPDLDWDYINDQIIKLDIKEFANLVFSLCNEFFAIKMPCGYDIPDEITMNYFTKYCVNNGVFGISKRNEDVYKYRIINSKQKNFKYFLEVIYIKITSIFPAGKNLKYKYKILKTKPYLLPAVWVYRIVFLIKNKFMVSICKFFGINRSKKETELQIEMFKKIGL